MMVLVDDDVAEGCLIYPSIPATTALAGVASADFTAIEGWIAPSEAVKASLITTDGAR